MCTCLCECGSRCGLRICEAFVTFPLTSLARTPGLHAPTSLESVSLCKQLIKASAFAATASTAVGLFVWGAAFASLLYAVKDEAG